MPVTFPALMCEATIVYGSDDRQPFVNVFYYLADSPPTGDPWDVPAAFLVGLDATLTASYLNVMASDSQVFGYTCTYHAGTGVVYTGVRGTPGSVGGLSGDTTPDFTAAVIQKRTTIPGKSGRGRFFIGCVAETCTDTSRLNTVGLANYEALRTAMDQEVTVLGAQFTPNLLSRKLDAFYEIDLHVLDVNLATQRRRRVRRLV